MRPQHVNRRQRGWLLEALQRELGGALCGLRAAVWGLAFKPGTDDMREAASLTLVRRLRRAGVSVALYDPVAMDNARRLLPRDPHIQWCASAEAALEQADVLLLVTEWPEFRTIAPQRIAEALRLRLVCDGRNALDPVACAAAGLRLLQVGRPVREAAHLGAAADAAALERDAVPLERNPAPLDRDAAMPAGHATVRAVAT